MTKNYVCCTPYLGKHTSYHRIFWCSRCFFHFFKILIFWVFRGVKRQKMVENDKKFCLTLYTRKRTSYDCGFWYTCVKWWYLQQVFFFHFFKILIFQVFQSSSVNAKRKFWGVPHLLHMSKKISYTFNYVICSLFFNFLGFFAPPYKFLLLVGLLWSLVVFILKRLIILFLTWPSDFFWTCKYE